MHSISRHSTAFQRTPPSLPSGSGGLVSLQRVVPKRKKGAGKSVMCVVDILLKKITTKFGKVSWICNNCYFARTYINLAQDWVSNIPIPISCASLAIRRHSCHVKELSGYQYWQLWNLVTLSWLETVKFGVWNAKLTTRSTLRWLETFLNTAILTCNAYLLKIKPVVILNDRSS